VICVAVIGGTSTAPLAEGKLDVATKLGRLLAASPVRVLTSGNRHGMIGRVLDSLQGSPHPRSAVVVRGSGEEEHVHPAAGTLILVPSVSDRKSVILQQAQGVIALPGGLGTHDEIITSLIEGKGAPAASALVLVNVDHYFDPFMALLENMADEGFLRRKYLASVQLVTDAEAAVNAAGVRYPTP